MTVSFDQRNSCRLAVKTTHRTSSPNFSQSSPPRLKHSPVPPGFYQKCTFPPRNPTQSPKLLINPPRQIHPIQAQPSPFPVDITKPTKATRRTKHRISYHHNPPLGMKCYPRRRTHIAWFNTSISVSGLAHQYKRCECGIMKMKSSIVLVLE